MEWFIQLGTRSGGPRRNLDYLLIRLTLKSAEADKVQNRPHHARRAAAARAARFFKPQGSE
jgi:hypothetical protein